MIFGVMFCGMVGIVWYGVMLYVVILYQCWMMWYAVIVVPLVALNISSVRALITSLGANNTMGSRLP